MSNTPVYVAGFERGVRPIGDWSISITLSNCSSPLIDLCLPGMHLARLSCFARLLYNTSLTNELLPEPDTPVTQVITPTGNFTLTFLRLFSAAPRTSTQPAGLRRFDGIAICFRPLRYAPVKESSFCMISCAVPCATTSPPNAPAPGPISTIWSAASIVSSSCSTTINVLPRSRNFNKVFKSLSLSLWWSPILGSSKI